MKRRRPVNLKYRVLAVARPSMRYRWRNNFEGVTLQARLVADRVMFYEVNGRAERNISEAVVRALFPVGTSVKDQPFIARENSEFYAVLYRDRKKYRQMFEQLKTGK